MEGAWRIASALLNGERVKVGQLLHSEVEARLRRTGRAPPFAAVRESVDAEVALPRPFGDEVVLTKARIKEVTLAASMDGVYAVLVGDGLAERVYLYPTCLYDELALLVNPWLVETLSKMVERLNEGIRKELGSVAEKMHEYVATLKLLLNV